MLFADELVLWAAELLSGGTAAVPLVVVDEVMSWGGVVVVAPGAALPGAGVVSLGDVVVVLGEVEVDPAVPVSVAVLFEFGGVVSVVGVVVVVLVLLLLVEFGAMVSVEFGVVVVVVLVALGDVDVVAPDVVSGLEVEFIVPVELGLCVPVELVL